MDHQLTSLLLKEFLKHTHANGKIVPSNTSKQRKKKKRKKEKKRKNDMVGN